MRIAPGIFKYAHGKYRVRVSRKYTTFYLGMYDTEESALQARDDFLISIGNGALVVQPEPEMYSKRWFEIESKKQRQDFYNRYLQK